MSDHYLAINLDNMPSNGWIWGCVFCFNMTSQIDKISCYEVYCCNKCKSSLKMTLKEKKIYVNNVYYDLIKVYKSCNKKYYLNNHFYI